MRVLGSRRAASGALFALIASALGLGACRSGPQLASRSFTRPGLEAIPTQSVAVLAAVSGPALLDDAELDVEPFPPPSGSGPLDDGRALDERRSRALARAIGASLEARGYEVEIAPLALARGSLEAARAALDAEALVVARAVPVDRVYILEELVQTQTVDPTGDGDVLQLPAGNARAQLVPGQIYLAQLFTFDRETGARLASEQLPGVPNDGLLRPESPLLEHGLTGAPAAGLEGEALEDAAIEGLTGALLSGYPAPRAGTPEGRAQLDAVDLEAELRRDRFFDRSHGAIEVSTGWTFETVGGDASLPAESVSQSGAALPGLGTGAFAPDGAFQALQVRAHWILPGGFSFGGVLGYGRIPGSYRRRIFEDAGDGGETDAIATQSISGGEIFGAGLGVGRLFALADGVFLHPGALVYAETWGFEVAPRATFGAADHTRLGLEGRLDLWFVPGGGPLLLRVGAHGRGGFDFDGPAFVGGGGSVGAGVVF